VTLGPSRGNVDKTSLISYLISALASPPELDAEQRYTPLSSNVTASMASTEPSNLVLGPESTSIGSAPVCAYHLQASEMLST